MSAGSLSDDLIFQGAIIALSDLRRIPADDPRHGAFRDAAAAWIDEAQHRLRKKPPCEFRDGVCQVRDHYELRA